MTGIVETEDTLHGKPRVQGTRIGAKTLYELYTLRDMSFEEIAEQYPSITPKDVETAVEYMEEQDKDKAAAIA
ncbi:DUF433 domain-containing protein [Candidatus Nanohalobium constans]|uniref:DUF433 domain-containing protein n=1 Tax=Candidatus Nanohalobium constans TaxID=2565781 RepID=A0A5Q0UFZ8_9ARCH|nr:DUF433 domain-containing protein [Candidatus Nanohalobium constans]QGA80526.1 hypothetical protein LC1Nh_0633 [Candidatus Nanohalobium constans]